LKPEKRKAVVVYLLVWLCLVLWLQS